MPLNKNLHQAKQKKNDEFYTLLTDIEKELRHYTEHFKDKVVYCNCDDPTISNFFKFFQLKFRALGLKKLITTCYKNQNPDLFSKHDKETSIGIAIAERERERERERVAMLNYRNLIYFRCKGMEILEAKNV